MQKSIFFFNMFRLHKVLHVDDTLSCGIAFNAFPLILNFLPSFSSAACLGYQEWYDYKLSWTPREYGGVDRLYVPARDIWLPDIVLYNK